MSQLDDLLARSRTPGRFVEKRRFTLARSKAIEKMREFALRHPRQYLLELIAAANLAGARWIAVDVTRDTLVVAWVGGRSLSRQELGELFDYLFADQGEASTRHLMQTAVGINAILQRRPRRIRIESGDTEGTAARLDLDHRGQGEVGTPSDSLAGTYIFAEFDSGWLGRFLEPVKATAEVDLVETRCLYTSVPILLNGQAPFGYRGGRQIRIFGVRNAVEFDDGQRRGALGVPEARELAGQIRVVVGGVWVTTRTIAGLGDQTAGVVVDDHLRKTADMSDVVEDARWIDMLYAVQPHATRLWQQHQGPTWRPPQLPPRIAESGRAAGPIEPAREPLPSPLTQLERGSVTLAELRAMPSQEPLFWVEPEASKALAVACDPASFPYRVLVLTEGEAASLEHALPEGPRPARLTNPEDVSFVHSAVSRRVQMHSIQVARTIRWGDARPVAIRMTLRLHLQGPEVRWDNGWRGPVRVAIRHKGRTVQLLSIDLPLHQVSVIVDLDRALTQDGPGLSALRQALRQAVLAEAWRLLPDGDALQAGTARRQLELALLADHARPVFVRDGDDLRLAVHLPSAWRAARQDLLKAPLAQTPDGPLSLERLVSLQGTDQVLWIEDEATWHLLEPLEARFGWGHLACPGSLHAPLAVAVRRGQVWSTESPGQIGSTGVVEILALLPTFAHLDPPAGFVAAPSPARAVVHWVREGESVQQLREGVQRLAVAIHQGEASDWHGAPARGLHAARAAGIAAVTLTELLTAGLTPGDVRLPCADGTTLPASTVLHDPATAVAAVGGAYDLDSAPIVATFDQVLALDRARAALGRPTPTPLVVDDHPEVWLGDDASAGGWLVRQVVDLPGVSGWLGLRVPWDPTPAVLVESTERLHVMPGFAERVPCHGLIMLHDAERLTPAQHDLLDFAGVQLFQQLLLQLDQDLPPAALHAAQRYATWFVLGSWQRRGQKLGEGLELALARRVPVRSVEGGDWGTLFDWLQTDAGARPPAPPGAPEATGPRPGARVQPLDTEGGTWSALQQPLQRALRLQHADATVQIVEVDGAAGPVLVVDRRSTRTRCALALTRTPLAQRALGGDRSALGLLLVHACQQLVTWSDGYNLGLDLLALQQAVLAARMLS